MESFAKEQTKRSCAEKKEQTCAGYVRSLSPRGYIIHVTSPTAHFWRGARLAQAGAGCAAFCAQGWWHSPEHSTSTAAYKYAQLPPPPQSHKPFSFPSLYTLFLQTTAPPLSPHALSHSYHNALAGRDSGTQRGGCHHHLHPSDSSRVLHPGLH